MNAFLKDFEDEETRFIDGSEYIGSWSALGMEGVGKFCLPHTAVFQGEFRDGTFHGHGSLYWPRGQRMDGIWHQGECKEKRYTFEDGLVFQKNDWGYCEFPDRRYNMCLINGLRPAGATLRTNNEKELIILPGCYDTGIGIFNSRTHCIVSYHDLRKVLEIPTPSMVQWILKYCQKGWDMPTGHRKDLYENWFSKRVDTRILFSKLLPFSNDSPESWWKRYKQILINHYSCYLV
ncbi:MORN repeat-containing protein 5 [Ptiloglossa arizonensis]|uniref:MORN repeat-containing protein 5 n=1 Tax=Ptiloglossa arizonensis TaxID=3350558 RepID=UPI003FA0ABDF